MKFLDKLSRDEMRTITGGYDALCEAMCYGDGRVSCDDECGHNSSCVDSCMSDAETWCAGYCASGV